MPDGVIAFSMQRQIIQINSAAKTFANLTNEDNTYEKVMRKLKLKVDFDKVLYMTNYKNVEEKTTVNKFLKSTRGNVPKNANTKV